MCVWCLYLVCVCAHRCVGKPGGQRWKGWVSFTITLWRLLRQSFTEPGAHPFVWACWPMSFRNRPGSALLPTLSLNTCASAQLLCGCWRFELRSSCFPPPTPTLGQCVLEDYFYYPISLNVVLHLCILEETKQL